MESEPTPGEDLEKRAEDIIVQPPVVVERMKKLVAATLLLKFSDAR